MAKIKVGCVLTPELKTQFEELTKEAGFSASEYLRLAVIDFVNTRQIPFSVQRSVLPRGVKAARLAAAKATETQTHA